MQTFLPYPNFRQSLEILDRRRLGKQRLEAFQILQVLENKIKVVWSTHPCIRMWKGYEEALKLYLNFSIEEWIRRGYKNNMEMALVSSTITTPHWLGDWRLHASHRANLLRKNPEYYGKFGWKEDPNAPYWWPVDLKNKKLNESMKKYWKNAKRTF